MIKMSFEIILYFNYFAYPSNANLVVDEFLGNENMEMPYIS